MEKNTFSDEKKDATAAYNFLLKNVKVILIAFCFSLFVSILITYFTDKEYLSKATIFPTNANTLEASIDNPQFGYDVEADRLIQLLNSNQIIDSVVKKFDLINYYHLDKTKNTWVDDMEKIFFSKIKFTRTPYMSIIISAQTRDPELSANIANSIIKFADAIRAGILKKNVYDAYIILEKEYLLQKTIVDTLVKKIYEMRNIDKSTSLILLMNQRLNIAIDKNASSSQNSTYAEQAINDYNFEQTKLNEIRMKYEKSKNTYLRPLPSIYVVESAVPHYRKVSPSYLINSIILCGFTLFATLGILFLKEKTIFLKSK